jgi:macrolide transport system ATP-binding/permease protein
MQPVIVGVADQDAATGSLIGSIELATVGRDWIEAGGPQGAAQFGLQQTTYTGLYVIADRLDRVSTVRTAITAVGYSTSAPENLIASVRRYLRVVEIVLAGVGGIALVVAALGIANALFAAVRERRREIGVLKAIGARDRDVLRVFVIEALVVGVLGGLIGAAMGTATAASVGAAVNRYLTSQGVAGIRLAVSVPLLALAVLGSGVLAVAAGLAPALRAARLPAREAVAG